MKEKITFWFAFITAIIFLFAKFYYVRESEKVKIKQSTIQLIHKFEGSVSSAYQDSAGHWTIGVGHRIKESEPHLLFARLSKQQIDNLLKRDLEPCESFLTQDLGYPLTQSQFDALMSLCHNIGLDNLASSKVIFDIKRNQEHSAANSFLLWNRPQELTKRRKEERKLFLQGA